MAMPKDGTRRGQIDPVGAGLPVTSVEVLEPGALQETLNDDYLDQKSSYKSHSRNSSTSSLDSASNDRTRLMSDKQARPGYGTTDPPPDVVTYPEGGLRAWLVVFGSFCGMFAAFGMLNTIGVFQAYLHENQLKEYNESTIGWIFSVYTCLAFMGGIVTGPVFDAHGPRLLVLSGSVIIVLSLVLTSFSHQYWHFILSYGFLGGVGTSLIFTPAVSAISHFFLVKRGNASGLAATGGAVGGVVFPLMLQDLFPRIGFAWSTRVLALIFAVAVLIANLLIRSRLPPKPGSSVMPDLRIFRDKSFALTTAGTYMMEWGLFIPLAYLPAFAASTGVMDGWGYQLIAILNGMSALGRWAPGFLADRIGRYNTMIITLILCMVSTMTLWMCAATMTLSPSTLKALTISYAAIFGLASGSNISLTPVCVGQLCGTEEYGRYYATCYSVVSIGVLTGIPIGGSLIEASGGRYWGVIIFTGVCYAISVASYVWAKGVKVGWKLTTVF